MILGQNLKFLVTLSVVKMELEMMSGDDFGSYQLIKTIYRDVKFWWPPSWISPKGLASNWGSNF